MREDRVCRRGVRVSRTLANELPWRAGHKVTLAGWLHRRRQLKSVSFAILRDRSGLAQVVLSDPETISQLADIPEESVLQVTGVVKTNPQAPGGAEVIDPTLSLL